LGEHVQTAATLGATVESFIASAFRTRREVQLGREDGARAVRDDLDDRSALCCSTSRAACSSQY
jgi:hypothetical protein